MNVTMQYINKVVRVLVGTGKTQKVVPLHVPAFDGKKEDLPQAKQDIINAMQDLKKIAVRLASDPFTNQFQRDGIGGLPKLIKVLQDKGIKITPDNFVVEIATKEKRGLKLETITPAGIKAKVAYINTGKELGFYPTLKLNAGVAVVDTVKADVELTFESDESYDIFESFAPVVESASE